MQRNIFAYTAPGAALPEYISVNYRDGEIVVTVRSKERPDVTSDITLPRDQAKELYRALLREVMPTNAA